MAACAIRLVAILCQRQRISEIRRSSSVKDSMPQKSVVSQERRVRWVSDGRFSF